jgi:ankyrin repeat protein
VTQEGQNTPSKDDLRAQSAQQNSSKVPKLESIIQNSPKTPKSARKKTKVLTNKYGESALHVAIKKGDYEKAKSLIEESEADVNMKDFAGEFSIMDDFH